MSFEAAANLDSADLVSQKYQEFIDDYEAQRQPLLHRLTESERCVEIGLKIIDKLAQSYFVDTNEKKLLLDVLIIKIIPKIDSKSKEKIMELFERASPEGQKRRQIILNEKCCQLARVLDLSQEKILKMLNGNEQDRLIDELHHLFAKKLQGCPPEEKLKCFDYLHKNISQKSFASFVSFLNGTDIQDENPITDIEFLQKIVKIAPEFLELDSETTTHLVKTLSLAFSYAKATGLEELFMGVIQHTASKGKKNLADFINLINRAPIDKIFSLIKRCRNFDNFIVFLETFNRFFNENGAILPELVEALFVKSLNRGMVNSFEEYLTSLQRIPDLERLNVVSIMSEIITNEEGNCKLDEFIQFFEMVPHGEYRSILDRAKNLIDKLADSDITLDCYSALHLIQAFTIEQSDRFIEQVPSFVQNKAVIPICISSFLLFRFHFPNDPITYKKKSLLDSYMLGLHPHLQIALISRAARLYAALNRDLGTTPIEAIRFLSEEIQWDQVHDFLENVPVFIAELNRLNGQDNNTKLNILKFVFRRIAAEERVDFIKLLCDLRDPNIELSMQELQAIPVLQRREKLEEINLQYELRVAQAGYLNNDPETLTINPADFSEEARNPARPLLLLFDQITENPRFPRIQYEDSLGSDYGGVTRDFVSKVFSSICHPDQKSLPLFESDERYFPMLLESEEPTLSLEVQTKCWQAIGMLFARTLNGDPSLNQASVTTGTHFHPRTFNLIHALTLDELDRIPDRLEENSVPEIKLKLIKIYLKAQYPNIFSPLGVDEAIVDSEIENLVGGRLSDRLIQTRAVGADFLNDYHVNAVIKATILIAKSMHRNLALPRQWGRLIGNSAESLRKKIEGSLTSDLVINAFGLKDESENTRKGMLKRWIRTANPQELKDLVFAITGSTSLSSGQKLEIKLYERLNNIENAPVFHTCSQAIDLPNYQTYEIFQEKLRISILSAVAGGFQLA